MKKARLVSMILIIIILVSSFSTVAFADGETTTCSSFTEACNVMRKEIMNRRNDVNSSAFDYYMTVSYKAKSYNEKTIYNTINKELFKYTGKQNEGDSLRAGIWQHGLSVSAKKSGSVYIITVVCYGNCTLTKVQTSKLDKWINSNAKKIATKNGTSDYAKTLAVYRWITKNCKYGRTMIGDEETFTTAYAAVYGKATCIGISDLAYRMLNAAGVQCRIMQCTNHAWVIVKIGGKWYIMDPTLALGKGTSYDKKYFLVGYSNYSRYSKRMKDWYGGNISVNKTNYKKK